MSSGYAHSNLLKTSLVASMAGAGMAVLLTPRTGKQTRDMLSSNASRLGNRSRHLRERLRRRIGKSRDDESASRGSTEERPPIQLESRKQTPTLTHWEKEL